MIVGLSPVPGALSSLDEEEGAQLELQPSLLHHLDEQGDCNDDNSYNNEYDAKMTMMKTMAMMTTTTKNIALTMMTMATMMTMMNIDMTTTIMTTVTLMTTIMTM